jgi:hypothetical protein
MPEGSEKSPITLSRARQLNCVNERIAKLAHANPQSNVYRAKNEAQQRQRLFRLHQLPNLQGDGGRAEVQHQPPER